MSKLQIDSEGKIALICEGNTERNILTILLDSEKLVFKREHLVEEDLIPHRFKQAKKLEREILSMNYKKLYLIFVQDNDNMPKINRLYLEKIFKTVKVITTPEIEMLMVHHFGLYQKYAKLSKSKWKKPSEFIASEMNMTTSKVKSKSFIEATFDPNSLIKAIKAYSSKSPKKYNSKNNIELVDILID